MTELARELLEGVQVGTCVEVTYGFGTSLRVLVGTVEKITNITLSVRDEKGKVVRLNLALLQAVQELEGGMPMDGKALDITVKEEAKKIFVDEADEALANAAAGGAAAEAAAPAPAEEKPIPPKAPAKGSLPAPAAYEVDGEALLDEVCKKAKAACTAEVYAAVQSIVNSLHGASRSGSMADKYHNLRARALKVWEIARTEIDFETFYMLVGIMAALNNDMDYSLEALVRARRYDLAFAAADETGHSKAGLLRLCAFMAGQLPQVDTDVQKACAAYCTAAPLAAALEKETSPERLAQIELCAELLARQSGKTLTGETAEAKIASFPPLWLHKGIVVESWQEYSAYTYPVVVDSTMTLTRRIGKVESREGWGFLDGDWFFHVAQIDGSTPEGALLRRAIYMGVGKGLEVSFRPATSVVRAGSSAAAEIVLTEAGCAEAQKRLSLNAGQRQQGVVEHFNGLNRWGVVRCEEENYSFFLRSVNDPWLRADLVNGCKEQAVTFVAETLPNGKKAANSLRLYALTEEIKSRVTLTEKLQEEWNERCANEVRTDYVPFSEVAYSELPPLEASSRIGKAFTWKRSRPIHK